MVRSVGPQRMVQISREVRTRRVFGLCLSSGSFIKQASTNSSSSSENWGPNLGAGSRTIWCISSMMLIEDIPSAPNSIPRLLNLLFLFFLLNANVESRCVGVLFLRSESSLSESLFFSSSRSERSSSSSTSQKGNCPVASSMSVIPSDHISDFTEYSAPWIRSGCGGMIRMPKKSRGENN